MVRSSLSFSCSGAADEEPAPEDSVEAGAAPEPEDDGAAEEGVLELLELPEQAARETNIAAAVITDSARVNLFMLISSCFFGIV